MIIFTIDKLYWNGTSLVDFTVQAAALPGNLDQLDTLWAAGVTSFEGLMSDAPDWMRLDFDGLIEAAGRTAACGGVLGILTGNQNLVEKALDRLADRSDYMAYIEARDPAGEASGLAGLVEVARLTGARIVARQVCTARGFAVIAEARAADPNLSLGLEVTPHHLRLDTGAVDRHGPFALMVPPLRSAADCEAARQALVSGVVSFVGSDHAPHAADEKDRASPWEVPGGTPGLDTIAPVVLDLAATGRISWGRVAEVLCGGPARLFGIAERKGRIVVGADGALVLVDPALSRIVDAALVHSRAERSPFEGERLTGWPVLTVLRGRVIAQEGHSVGDAPQGQWVPRGTLVWT